VRSLEVPLVSRAEREGYQLIQMADSAMLKMVFQSISSCVSSMDAGSGLDAMFTPTYPMRK
jgi:hypothetical protein